MTGYGKLLERARNTIETLRGQLKAESEAHVRECSEIGAQLAKKNYEVERLSIMVADMKPLITDRADHRAADELEEALAPKAANGALPKSAARAVAKKMMKGKK